MLAVHLVRSPQDPIETGRRCADQPVPVRSQPLLTPLRAWPWLISKLASLSPLVSTCQRLEGLPSKLSARIGLAWAVAVPVRMRPAAATTGPSPRTARDRHGRRKREMTCTCFAPFVSRVMLALDTVKDRPIGRPASIPRVRDCQRQLLTPASWGQGVGRSPYRPECQGCG